MGSEKRINIDIAELARDYGLQLTIPKAVVKASERVNSNAGAIERATRKRKDLRRLDLVTVDGADAQDFDDAVHCAKNSNDEYELTVAIADVSFFVKAEGKLDIEASKRATSAYFPGLVLPMLPPVLSNDLCSLVPKQDRLALACTVTIGDEAEVLEYGFFECVIRSSQRLTYHEAQMMLDKKLQGTNVEKSIACLSELCTLLEAARAKRGGLMIDLPTQTPVIRNGKVQKIELEYRLHSHKIIEECMLLANICAADFLKKKNYPFLYRIHPKPPQEKLDRLSDILHDMEIKAGNLKHTATLQQVINQTHKYDPLTASVLTSNVLRTLERATYTPNNIGHFGLGYRAYTHFTSPIRRYPDLLVHRAIKAALNGRHPNRGLKKELVEIGAHCTERELAAERASLNYTSRLVCRTLKDKVGSERKGVISGMSNGGMFLSFADGTEGMLRFRALDSDYYELSKNKTRAIGRRQQQTYHVGMRMQVKILEVNMEEGRCQLAPA